MNVSIKNHASSPTERPSHSPYPQFFPSGHLLPFVLVTALFFIWGMSNNLTDILVQQFKKSFELSPLQAQLVQTAVFFGYFFTALPAALGMRRWGYKAGILAGLCLFGTGTLMFWPAAIVGQYWLMLVALFVVGCGSATLETAANPFIAQFGPAETSERRLNFSQAFNPPGTIAGVLIGTYFIFSGIELAPTRVVEMKAAGTYAGYLHSELMRVVPTYVTLGCVVFLFAACIGVTRFPDALRPQDEENREGLVSQLVSLLRVPTLRAAIFAQFCYCGAQVSTWSAFIPYVKQSTHASERVAALFLTGNLIAFALGRIVSTGLMRWIRPASMMGVYAIVNVALLCVGILHPGTIGAGAILCTSFFMSIMFPTIFALGVKGLGERTKLGGSLIVMSVVGAGIIPPLVGLIAKHFRSYALGYTVVIGCYLVVGAYAFLSREDAEAAVGRISRSSY
ncbi:MAG TPA: L-fucose:H+ symporter permease [Granulicella sp.]|jgi:FHS family L-fucose permease-like MFS transporter|nr:L-fucose:H+ symporter permease [Granulicella sp.]